MKLLIGLHAMLGEISTAFLFLWIFVEYLNPTENRIRRTKVVALWAMILFAAAWIVAGIYYLGPYASEVRPVILAGPARWAHSIIMETKEHIFLFIPFLIVLAWGIIGKQSRVPEGNASAKAAVLRLSVLIVLLGLLMVGMGFMISLGARVSLEEAK